MIEAYIIENITEIDNLIDPETFVVFVQLITMALLSGYSLCVAGVVEISDRSNEALECFI